MRYTADALLKMGQQLIDLTQKYEGIFHVSFEGDGFHLALIAPGSEWAPNDVLIVPAVADEDGSWVSFSSFEVGSGILRWCAFFEGESLDPADVRETPVLALEVLLERAWSSLHSLAGSMRLALER